MKTRQTGMRRWCGTIAGARRLVVEALAILLLVISLGCATEQINYPLDYAPPAEFLLGPEDVLVVTVWRNQDLSRDVVVRPDGMISMPLIGDVPAAGLTANELAKRISERLKEFMATPTVSVQVKEVNSYFIYVLGEVTKPGKYPLKSFATVMQGVSLAGGFTPFASKNRMRVLRISKNGHGEPHQIQIPVRYDELLAGEGSSGNFFLKSGDVIVVP
ncbi:MAG: polysaccharide biosynthesis/export family protein [Nitrospiraceae bacterium]